MAKIIGIHQPNFFPWIGYFVKIARSDLFVFLDDVQIIKTGGSYVNRCKIVQNNESKWLTANIKRDIGVWSIKDTCFFDSNWRDSIKGSIHNTYLKAPFYKIHKNILTDLLDFNTDNLSEFNIYTIKKLVEILKINTQFIKSSEINTSSTSTQRLIDIVKNLNGSTYLSGTGGDNYQNIKEFEHNSIKLIYNTFEHPIYRQWNSLEFIKGLSILDFIFNMGIEEVINFFKQNSYVEPY